MTPFAGMIVYLLAALGIGWSVGRFYKTIRQFFDMA